MELKTIDEIKNGTAVFMPSGIRAKLFLEDDNVIVEYPELYRDKYTKEQFTKLMEEGIQVLGNYPNTYQKSAVMENKETIVDKLSKKGFIRKSLLEAFEKQEAPGALFTVMQDEKQDYLTDGFKKELLVMLDRIAREYPNVKVRQQALTFLDAYGLQEYFDTKAAKEFATKYMELLNTHVNESLNEEDEFNSIDIQRKMDEISDTLSKRGWTKVDATIQADAGLVLKKNNLELSLTLMEDGKIFIQYDYPEQKEKNLSKTDFMYNIYKILSNLDVEFIGINESLNEDKRQDILDKIAKEVYAKIEEIYNNDPDLMEYVYVEPYIKPGHYDDGSDLCGIEVRLEQTYEGMMNMADELDPIVRKYDKTAYFDMETGGIMTAAIDLDKYESITETVKEITKAEWDKTPNDYKMIRNGQKYIMYLDPQVGTVLGPCKIIDETLNEEQGPHFGKDSIGQIAAEIEAGNKSGYEPTEFGNWMLNTSMDSKWEAITEPAKDFLMEKIAMPVADGHVSYDDLEIYVSENSALAKEDVESFNVFMADELDEIFTYGDELKFLISYELQFDGQLGESFKVKKNKKKKEKIDDSMNEEIYDGDLGNEEPMYHYSVEDIDQRGDDFDNAEEAWEQAVEDLTKLGYEVKEPNDDAEFEIVGKETGVAYTGVIYPSYDYLDESINENNVEFTVKSTDGEEGPFATREAAEEYISQQVEQGKKEEEFEIVTNNGDNDMSKEQVTPAQTVTESYKVYHTQGAEVVSEVDCDSWQGVEEYLNQTWGDYRASMVKENPEFGTDEDKDNFFGEFEIEPIEVEVEITPEGPEAEVQDVCPECGETECICEPALCPECGCEPCECEAPQEEPAVEPEEEPLEEDFGEEHLGEPENEEPEESEEDEEEEETEEKIENPEQAKDIIDNMEDALDTLEDYIKELLDAEEPQETEEATEVEETEEPLEESVKPEPPEDDKNEEFKDGMLTDVSKLDMPDAIAQSIDVNDDGTVMRLTDLMNQIKTMKSEVEKMIADFKTDMKDALGNLQQTIQRDVNDVDNKVQDTKTAVDNLTTEEEEDLEAVEFNEPVEEEPMEKTPAEEETEEAEEEQVEESVKEKGAVNPIFEAIETIINEGGKTKSMVKAELKDRYGYDCIMESMDICVESYIKANKLDEKLVGTDEALKLQEEATANDPIKKFLKKHGKGRLHENLDDAKKKADELIAQGKDAVEVKDAITLLTDNDEEKKQAAEYAVEKMKESMLKTSKKSKLGGLGQVG